MCQQEGMIPCYLDSTGGGGYKGGFMVVRAV